VPLEIFFSNDKLVQMLNDQKCSFNKSGLNFDKFAASSSHDASTSRTVFVKPKISETHVVYLDNGKNVIVHDHVKVESKISVKEHYKFRFIPTCFHCGIIGHTRPYCLQIRSQRPWTKKNDPNKGKLGTKPFMPKYAPRQRRQSSQRSVSNCHHCGKIVHTQSSYFKMKPHEHKYDSSYSRKRYERLCNMIRDVLTRLDRLDKIHNIAPRFKKAWVRKVDTIHPLRGSGSGST
jgi:hypothetical protein